MSDILFYKPFKGKLFDQGGFLGKRVLVVGASVYCKEKRCPFYTDCTDRKTKDSSAFDKLCPLYNKEILGEHLFDSDHIMQILPGTDESTLQKISDAPELEIYSWGDVFIIFGEVLSKAFFNGEVGWLDVWERLSFTEYVQFVLPNWQTLSSDITNRDLEALIDVIDDLRPDVLIVWGCVINKPIQALSIDKDELRETGNYLCHIEHKGKNIPVVNPYHPSSTHWKGADAQRQFITMLKKALSE